MGWRFVWSGKRDSNSRPRPWQGRALPTELFPQIFSENLKELPSNGTAKICRKFESANFLNIFTKTLRFPGNEIWMDCSGGGCRVCVFCV